MPVQSCASASRSSESAADGTVGHGDAAERQGADQDCGCTRRMSPSCAVLATSTPSRE